MDLEIFEMTKPDWNPCEYDLVQCVRKIIMSSAATVPKCHMIMKDHPTYKIAILMKVAQHSS